MLVGIWKNWNSYAVPMGMQTGTATLENGMEIPQKLKQNYHDAASLVLNIYTPQITNRVFVHPYP